MKKILVLTLLLALLLPCFSPALAATAQYANTKDFAWFLDIAGLEYTIDGVDSQGRERLTLPDSRLNFFFSKDNRLVELYCWNVLRFRLSDLDRVLRIVNQLNENSFIINISVNEDDCSVNVYAGAIVREGEGVYDIVSNLSLMMLKTLPEVVDSLKAYAR